MVYIRIIVHFFAFLYGDLMLYNKEAAFVILKTYEPLEKTLDSI